MEYYLVTLNVSTDRETDGAEFLYTNPRMLYKPPSDHTTPNPHAPTTTSHLRRRPPPPNPPETLYNAGLPAALVAAPGVNTYTPTISAHSRNPLHTQKTHLIPQLAHALLLLHLDDLLLLCKRKRKRHPQQQRARADHPQRLAAIQQPALDVAREGCGGGGDPSPGGGREHIAEGEEAVAEGFVGRGDREGEGGGGRGQGGVCGGRGLGGGLFGEGRVARGGEGSLEGDGTNRCR